MHSKRFGRWGLWAGAALAAVAAVSACASSPASSAGAAPGASSSPSALATSIVPLSQLSGTTINVTASTFQPVLQAAGLADTPYKVNYVTSDQNPADLTAAVASGKADLVTDSDVFFSSLLSAGLPVTVVHAQQRPQSYCGILVQPNSPIKTVAQLKGVTIANTLGEASEVVAIRAFKAVGLDFFTSAHIVSFQSAAESENAFVSGKAQAWVACSQPVIALTSTGKARWVINGAYDGYWAAQNFWAVSDTALANPDKRSAILDYIKRIDEATVWGNAHLAAESQAEAKFTDASYSVTLAYNSVGPTTGIPVTQTVVNNLQSTYNLEASLGNVKAGLDVGKYFTTAFNSYFGEK
jgi:sulfonate transport system substrate-binding protein